MSSMHGKNEGCFLQGCNAGCVAVLIVIAVIVAVCVGLSYL